MIQLLLILSALLFPSVAFATVQTLPADLMFGGKPIDPVCIYNIVRHKDVELKEACSSSEWELTDEGTLVTRAPLKEDTRGFLGYDYDFGNGMSGYLGYRYLGKISEGLVLEIMYSSGGTGQFSDLSVYKRNKDTLLKVRMIEGGDRCSHGLLDGAKVENGHLLYAYDVTPLELYQTYSSPEARNKDLANGLINCGAVISVKDEKIESVKLYQDTAMYYPECFKSAYAAQIKSKDTLTDHEAKAFIQKFVSLCVRN